MQCTESRIMPISLCEEALMAPQIDHKIWPYTKKLRQSEWKTTSPHRQTKVIRLLNDLTNFVYTHEAGQELPKNPKWQIKNKIKAIQI